VSEAKSHGAVLGPILCSLFINDIAEVCCGTTFIVCWWSKAV